MENAAKALLMAAAVLISLVIISMLMLMGNSLTSYQKVEVQNQRENEIFAFNQQYEGYNRKGVRGNELFSLISKVTDYNNRKSSLVAGTEQFEPMAINFSLKGKELLFAKDGTNLKLFEKHTNDFYYEYNDSNYSKNLKERTFDKISDLTKNKIPNSNNGANIYYTEAILNKLVVAYEKIFLDNYNDFKELSEQKKVQLFYDFNSIVGADFFEIPLKSNKKDVDIDKLNTLWYNSFSKGKSIRENVDTYYEYVQFKRAIFNVKSGSVLYNQGTGRIISMSFDFTGKFE